MKKCVEIDVILFKNWKYVFKIIYQTRKLQIEFGDFDLKVLIIKHSRTKILDNFEKDSTDY